MNRIDLGQLSHGTVVTLATENQFGRQSETKFKVLVEGNRPSVRILLFEGFKVKGASVVVYGSTPTSSPADCRDGILCTGETMVIDGGQSGQTRQKMLMGSNIMAFK